MGVQLYAKFHMKDDITEHANFQNLWRAFLMLLRMSTGENWNGLMYSMADTPDGCVDDPDYNPDWCVVERKEGCIELNGCGNDSVFPYWYSFTLVVTFVMLNLFIGVILDAFDSCDEAGVPLDDDMLDRFIECWAKFDSSANCYIEVDQLPALLQILDTPMGFGEEYNASNEELEELIGQMMPDMPINDSENNKLHFNDVAKAIAKKLTMSKQGDAFQELPNEHQVMKQWSAQGHGQSDVTIGSLYNLRKASRIEIATQLYRKQEATTVQDDVPTDSGETKDQEEK
jgi:hypothetical protein